MNKYIDTATGMYKYLISKGKHRSVSPFKLSIILISNHFHKKKKFSLNDNCRYEPKDDDVNKLYGYSFRLLPKKIDGKWHPGHHWNSIRVGWRMAFNSTHIELLLYAYVDGVRIIKSLGYVNTHTSVYSTIDLVTTINGSYITLTLQDRDKVHINEYNLHLKSNPWIGYRCYPFFGGDLPAPHDMTIQMKSI